MKCLQKTCKTTGEIRAWLKRIGLGLWDIYDSTNCDGERKDLKYYDIDCWMDAEQTWGASITFFDERKYGRGIDVHVSKYTRRDIEALEA